MSYPSGLAGSLAGARGARASQAPRAPAPLLESFTTRPAVAGWVGGRLNSFYSGNIIRIRRASDDAEINVGCVTGTNRLDTAAVAAHCAGTTGYLKTVYDQSGNGKDLTQATNAKQHAIYESGALVLGANGYLGVHFDPAKNAGYATAALGLTGAPAVTYALDVAEQGTGTPYMTTGLVQADATVVYMSDLWFDQGAEADSYSSTFDAGANTATVSYPDFAYAARWLQFGLAAGAAISTTAVRVNGSAVTPVGVGTDGISVGATDGFAWGVDTWAPGDVICSAVLLWTAALTPDEQTTLDAWMETHHA